MRFGRTHPCAGLARTLFNPLYSGWFQKQWLCETRICVYGDIFFASRNEECDSIQPFVRHNLGKHFTRFSRCSYFSPASKLDGPFVSTPENCHNRLPLLDSILHLLSAFSSLQSSRGFESLFQVRSCERPDVLPHLLCKFDFRTCVP